MNRDTRVEFAAIPIVAVILGGLFLILLAAHVGMWAWILLAVFALVLIVAVAVWLAGRSNRTSAQDIPTPALPASPDGTHRVLVVADESVTSESFSDTMTAHAAGRSVEALVIAPALSSRLARWTGDESAYQDAQQHLDATIATLNRAGITARGVIGPHDPLQAADDGLREFAAGEIVFVTQPAERSNWLEDGVVDQARSRYEIPVTHIVIAAADR